VGGYGFTGHDEDGGECDTVGEVLMRKVPFKVIRCGWVWNFHVREGVSDRI